MEGMTIEASIQGIPCLVRVTCYQPETPPITWGPMDWADPGADEVIEFDVLDHRGRPAPWLERKMQSEDRHVIEQEIIAAIDDDCIEPHDDYGAAENDFMNDYLCAANDVRMRARGYE